MIGVEFVTQIWLLIATFFNNLVGMLNSSATKDYFLTSFAYVLVAFWIVWVVLNTFIIRPFALGGISLDLVAHERAKQQARIREQEARTRENERKAEKERIAAERAKPRHYTRTHTNYKGQTFKKEYTRYEDGSVESRDV